MSALSSNEYASAMIRRRKRNDKNTHKVCPDKNKTINKPYDFVTV